LWLEPIVSNLGTVLNQLRNGEFVCVRDTIDDVYVNVVTALNSAANLHVPRSTKNFCKFWWDEEVKQLKEESVESNNMWKTAGKPRHGPIFDRRQRCRARYRRRVRDMEKSSLTSYTNDLHECLLKKNGPTFWWCWKSKFESRTSTCVEVDGSVDSYVIVNKFANHFSSAYTSNSPIRAAGLYADYISMRKNYQGLPLTVDFNVELVSNVIAKLKRGKAADLDNLTAEHLIHSHPILSVILCKLFNLILISGYVPTGFGYSYTVPICKLQDSRVKSVKTRAVERLIFLIALIARLIILIAR